MTKIDDTLALQIYREGPPDGSALTISRAFAPTDPKAYEIGVAAQGAFFAERFRNMPPNPIMDELGVTGLNRMGSHVYEEWHRQLQGRRGMTMYREMWDSEIILDISVRYIMMLCAFVPWKPSPKDANNPEAVKWAEWFKNMMKAMKRPWYSFIMDALTALPFGFSYSEVCFQELKDGTVGWEKFSPRSQEALDGWLYDEKEKECLGLYLRPVYGPVTFVPKWKAFHFVPFGFRENPEGRSMFRSSFMTYKALKEKRRIEGVGFDRNVSGYPMAFAPPHYFDAALNNDDSPEARVLANLAKLAYNVRMDSRMGAVFPSPYNKDGSRSGFDLAFATVNGAASSTPLGASIVRDETRLSMAMHCEMLMLGQDGRTGSHAMHSDKTTMVGRVAYALMDMIADILNTDCIPKLMQYNGVEDPELWPQLGHDDVEEVDVNSILNSLKSMFDMGMPVDNPDITRKILQRLGLPVEASSEV